MPRQCRLESREVRPLRHHRYVCLLPRRGQGDRQGEQSTALPLYRQALATRERALGPVHPEVAVSLQAIAGLHLADRGGSPAGSGGALVSYEDALALARSQTFDGALLDVNLRGRLVYPVAEELMARKVPITSTPK